MTLAELLAEAKRLDEAAQRAADFRSVDAFQALETRDEFRAAYFPRLVRVAEAAMEMRREVALDHGDDVRGDCPLCASAAAFDAEVQEEPKP